MKFCEIVILLMICEAFFLYSLFCNLNMVFYEMSVMRDEFEVLGRYHVFIMKRVQLKGAMIISYVKINRNIFSLWNDITVELKTF